MLFNLVFITYELGKLMLQLTLGFLSDNDEVTEPVSVFLVHCLSVLN